MDSKKKTRRHWLPLAIASSVVISGIATIAYEVSNGLPYLGNCENGSCEKTVPISIELEYPVSDDLQNSENREVNKSRTNRLQDVESENNRLLLQRDIQREINLRSIMKPFNYRPDDYCKLGLSKNKKNIVINECSNHVFKRAIYLAIENGHLNELVSKYDFKNESPTFEVRIKF